MSSHRSTLISSHTRSHSFGSESSDEANIVADPATFDFPTLNSDGSVPDLTSTPRFRYPPTPPAALSSLGAALRMASPEDMSEPFSDAQYDMVDDASELSTDDHETASLPSTSTEQEVGQLTPDDANSTTGVEEEQEDDTIVDSVTLGEESYDTIRVDRLETVDADKVKQMNADNEVMDSIGELVTPHQSLGPSGIAFGAMPSSSTLTSESSTRTLRVLFASESGLGDDQISPICHRIASSLAGKDYSMSESLTQLVRLPPTPTGIKPSCALFLRTGSIEMIIEHCIGAEPRNSSPDSYGLRIQDADKEHTSVFTLGANGKIDLQLPDLVIFYLSQPTSYPLWFSTVKRAMNASNVPNITVGAPEFNFESLTELQKTDARETDLLLTDDQFYEVDDIELRAQIETMLDRRSTPKTSAVKKVVEKIAKRSPVEKMGLQLFGIAILLTILLNLCMPFLGFPNTGLATTAANLAGRRDALSTALVRMTNSTDAAKVYNISHLLPHPDEFKDSKSELIPPHVRHQGAPPNHVVLSLPSKRDGRRRFPEVVETHVYKENGQGLEFNLTKLIDGVYDVTIPISSTSGNIEIRMITKKPAITILLHHDFGNKFFQRKTYEKASTDLTKTMNKEVAVARKNAKSLGEKMGLELGASAAATKNVTTEIALYMLRELQVLGNTGVSVLGKAAAASNVTAVSLKKELMTVQKDLISLGKEVKKDLIVVQKDVVEFSKGVKTSLSSTAKTAKAFLPNMKKSFKSRLALSRQRALGLKALMRRKQKANSPKVAVKALSNRVSSMFKPFQMPDKKPMGFWNVQRCLYTHGPSACKERQKMLVDADKADFAEADSMKVSDKGVGHKASKLARKCAGRKKAAEMQKEKDEQAMMEAKAKTKAMQDEAKADRAEFEREMASMVADMKKKRYGRG